MPMNEEIFAGKGCGPEISEELIDPEHLRKIQSYPCFSKEAAHRFGRIHLPVAPKCNIQCNYCVRDFDCVNESRPGVTSQVLSPAEALERVQEVVARFDNIRTVGIAGPGEPLVNKQTFETFQLIKDSLPDLHLCLSSNGLLLPDKLEALHDLGVGTITVTMSAIDPDIGKEIYAWVAYGGSTYYGRDAAEFLLSKQLEGIKGAAERGMVIKVNSVMIPSINDHHLVEIAKKAKELGAFVQNIMPLIPQAKFAQLRPPTLEDRKRVQDESAAIIGQMRHCRQCRADAIGLIGRDVSQTLFTSKKAVSEVDTQFAYKVAITSSGKDGTIDLHFGQARKFLIYGINTDNSYAFIESRELETGDEQPTISEAAAYFGANHPAFRSKSSTLSDEIIHSVGANHPPR